MDICKIYTKYSDVIPIEKEYALTRSDKKYYDLGFFDACEKINDLLKDLPIEVQEQIEKKLNH